MAKNILGPSQAAGHQRVAHLDGHGVNESYKQPSATGKGNPSYMHPQVQKPTLQKAFQTADSALGEASRPIEQLGQSKTVFAVKDAKQRGTPLRPPFAKATRATSHAPTQPGVLPSMPKPTVE